MAWVVNVADDPTKTNVGGATLVFTDTDGSTFTANTTATLNAGNAQAFVTAAVAAKSAWLTRKTAETSQRTVLVNDLVAAGESASAQTIGNNGSVTFSAAS